jgi:hypothetical protein
VSGLALLVALVAIQFVPVETSNPAVTADVPTSVAVKAVLRRACHDCHSNETQWPWYSRIAPVSWLLARDVREGRAELKYRHGALYPTPPELSTKDGTTPVEVPEP